MISDFGGKLVIITGAGRGNGAAIAEGFSSIGANVWGIDLEFVNSSSNLFRQIHGDVSEEKFVSAIASEANSTGLEIVLVNNAGITLPSAHPYPLTNWNRTLSLNLTAPFLWIEALIPSMIKSMSGSIINITSLAAERGFPENPAYVASKGGLKMLSKAYARDLGEFNVRVNNVGPGYVETSMTNKSYRDDFRKMLIARHTLLGRWGKSSDLVGVCLFLASDAALYITGQDFYVDGGWLANGLHRD